MLLLLDPVRARATPRIPENVSRWIVPCAAFVAVAARLPFLDVPAGADEAGFLQVAAQWSSGGDSLYGHYWVDRPPLLITLFQLASSTGGLVPLRLLGCLAAAAAVLLIGWTARQIGGDRARSWSVVAGAALTVSPLAGALEVNGELLAAPLVALGLGASVAAVRSADTRWACVAGAAAVAALMVKQNFADVLIFGTALLIASLLNHSLPRGTAGRLASAAAAGGATTLVALSAWTVAHGTSLIGVFDAIYPFRLQAARVLAAGDSQYAGERLAAISGAYVASGLALMAACLVVHLARSRLQEPALVALAATVAFDLVSITMGGGYWLHYLVQLIVPVSVGIGLAAANTQGFERLLTRAALAFSVIASAVSLTSAAIHPPSSDGQDVGRAIGSVATPGDTLTTLYGEPQVNLEAGLPSPYQHLWSLPIKTLDPDLTQAQRILAGPQAPTWLVTSHHVPSWGLSTDALEAIVAARYHLVATIHDQTVYLLDSAQRATPSLTNTAQESS